MDRWLIKGTAKDTVSQQSPGPSTSENIENETTVETCINPEKEVSATTTSILREPATKKRKYDESYLSLGFVDANNMPQCVLCSKLFPNSSMVPAKMRRHLETVHPEFIHKKVDYFMRGRDELLKRQNLIVLTFKTSNEKATEASYIVCYRIALAGEAHTIAETLIKPCAVDIAKCILDESLAKEINNVPLTNDTVANVKAVLISRLQCCTFSLQMDESTDVAGLAVLLVFVRYQHLNLFEEDLLLCELLPTNTTCAEIFNIVDNFFNTNGLDWKNCIDICTDGAKAMIGKTAGAVAKIKNIAPNCTNSHCILHRQALAVKKMPLSLKKVLDESVKIINFIKSRPLQTRLFKILCEDMGSVHKALLLHTEVRWLSRGKVLVRLFELRSEMGTFFMKNSMDLQERLTDKLWLFRLGYLADIFSKINKVNMSLQGKQVTVFTANDKIQAFKKKLEFWII